MKNKLQNAKIKINNYWSHMDMENLSKNNHIYFAD